MEIRLSPGDRCPSPVVLDEHVVNTLISIEEEKRAT
jgi:hypothetical protein